MCLLVVLVSALPLRAEVAVFRLVAPGREPPLRGSQGDPAPGGEPEPEGEASLGCAAGDFLPSSPKL